MKSVAELRIYRRVVHEYSMSGDYIGNHKVPDGITNVALKDDSCFIGYKPWYMSGDNIDRLILLDKNQDSLDIFTLSKFEKKENVKIDIFRMAEFYNTSGKCYIGIPFDNIIYSISEDNNVRKEIYIEQGKYALPKDIALNTDLYNKNLDFSYIFELNAKCMDNWVCMSFFYGKEHYRVVYDTSSKSFYSVSQGRDLKGIVNDIDNGASFWPLWVDSGVAIGCINIENLEDNLNEMYQTFKMYDNPVLQIAYY